MAVKPAKWSVPFTTQERFGQRKPVLSNIAILRTDFTAGALTRLVTAAKMKRNHFALNTVFTVLYRRLNSWLKISICKIESGEL
jgi:hypothetical protein